MHVFHFSLDLLDYGINPVMAAFADLPGHIGPVIGPFKRLILAHMEKFN